MTYSVGAHEKLVKQIDRFKKAGAQAQMKMLITRCRDAIAADPASASYRLHGNLSVIQRLKMGRFRLFFIYSDPMKRITFLYIGQRKKGSSDDAYAEFEGLLKRGVFDDCLAELGLPRDR